LYGWLLANRERLIEIVDVFGRHQLLNAREVTVVPYSLQQESNDLKEIRRRRIKGKLFRFEDEHRVSVQGTATGQFELGYIRTPEALVAAELFARGQKRLAAELLFPCLDEMDDDRSLRRVMRTSLGNLYHIEMLEQFCLRRDYEAAISLARHLSKPEFDGHTYQGRAQELVSQLERRREDFRSFVLPTEEAWKAMKNSLTVQEQIEYLCPRLRLLNCIQQGQPGSIELSDVQFAQPLKVYLYTGISGNLEKLDRAAIDRWRSRNTESGQTINPYVELKRLAGLPDAVKWLSPYREDGNFTLCMGWWRDFHPERRLVRIGDVVRSIIGSAGQER